MNILIVEDEFSIRLGVKTQLRGFTLTRDATIFDVRSIDAAERHIASLNFIDIAIIDLRMPSPAGFDDNAGFRIIELLQNSKSYSNKPTPVIILTSRTDTDATKQAEQFANVHYMLKPWQQCEFLSAVEQCLAETGEALADSPSEGSV